MFALTGGIASGKSAVSDQLAELGATIIDTDMIAREVVEPGQPGLQQVVEAFGKEVLDTDGHLDRRQLRERVFADEQERKRLEAILHPLIESRVRECIAASRDAPMIVLVVPLLVESGLFGDVDGVIVVDVPEPIQIERLLRRDGIDKDQAESILAAQATREQRLAVADFVVDNSGSLEALEEQVKKIFLSQRR